MGGYRRVRGAERQAHEQTGLQRQALSMWQAAACKAIRLSCIGYATIVRTTLGCVMCGERPCSCPPSHRAAAQQPGLSAEQLEQLHSRHGVSTVGALSAATELAHSGWAFVQRSRWQACSLLHWWQTCNVEIHPNNGCGGQSCCVLRAVC